MWSSFLILLSSHKTKTAIDGICSINYKVTQPYIAVHTDLSPCPCLFSQETLHKNITTNLKVCMHNLGEIVACFLWGSIAGTQSDLMKIQFTPKSGLIKPGGSFKVDVQLTPLKLGLFEHIYVPCFVGKMNDPIMLRIFCFVENIFVNIHLPNEKGKFDVVYWPPRMVNEFEIGPSEYDYLNKEFPEV